VLAMACLVSKMLYFYMACNY